MGRAALPRRLCCSLMILALDQSTSATKAVLFDARGKVLDKASRPHRQIYLQPGWVEHDAEEIWKNVVAGGSASALVFYFS